MCTYVANVDDGVLVATRGSIVGERIGNSRRRIEVAAAVSTTKSARRSTAAAVASTSSTVSTTKSATTSETSTSAEAAACTKSATTEASAATEARTRTGEAVFTNFKVPTLPIVTIELLNSLASILGAFKGDDSRSLGATSRVHMHIGSDDGTVSS